MLGWQPGSWIGRNKDDASAPCARVLCSMRGRTPVIKFLHVGHVLSFSAIADWPRFRWRIDCEVIFAGMGWLAFARSLGRSQTVGCSSSFGRKGRSPMNLQNSDWEHFNKSVISMQLENRAFSGSFPCLRFEQVTLIALRAAFS